MLAALGVADEPAASQYFYVIRGPQQTLRCSIMRRITKLLPETYPIYKEVNEGSGLTKKGLQQKKDDCLLFFNKVLAEHLAAEFTPTQAECAPLRELDYVARLLSMVAGRTITAAQVNDVFIPGEKNYTVNKSAAAELLGDAPESFTVPLGGSYQQEARSNSASNISASSALPAQPGEAAAAAARLGVSRRAPKRPGGVSSSSTPLKKRR
ncbi:hypothetical protein OEZ86_003315 [Tetradesmus obliquus]|nr:hypothetical protein OEZ86_003315 [Tetradesmus obliquus]